MLELKDFPNMISKKYNPCFITYELSPGISTVEDLSENLQTHSDGMILTERLEMKVNVVSTFFKLQYFF